jgi:alpha-tubulin suppressor-like RCC1 family protein
VAFIRNGQGDLKEVFITEAEIIDRYVGNQLWLWGADGGVGTLGTNTTTDRSSPVQTVSTGNNWKQFDAGFALFSHSAAIKTDGTLWLWGNAACGRLGNNSTTSRSSPVQTVSTGTNWKQVSLGVYHSAAIKTDGTLWLWGEGFSGNLGNNSTLIRSSPVQTVSTGTNWKQISISSGHSAAVKTDGTLWLWGCGKYGQLGNNSSLNSSSPVQTVSTDTNWKQVSLGGGASAAAIKTDGTLWLWGSDPGSTLRSSPVQTVSTGTNWKQVSLGHGGLGSVSVAGIKTDGTLWLWGPGSCGKLGNNSTTGSSSPVQTITTGNNWKQVCMSTCHAAAIKTDGTLWLWGRNRCGVFGNNSAVDQSSPVQTITTGTNWKQVSLGVYHSGAVTFTEF